MNERMKRFTDLMRQIFELDKADLDFGIYRIIVGAFILIWMLTGHSMVMFE